MKGYHLYFYLLKILILIFIGLISLKIINVKNKYYIIIESIFKFSLGLFIIIYFSMNKNNNIILPKHDRIIIILSGFILILLVDYKNIINDCIISTKH